MLRATHLIHVAGSSSVTFFDRWPYYIFKEKISSFVEFGEGQFKNY